MARLFRQFTQRLAAAVRGLGEIASFLVTGVQAVFSFFLGGWSPVREAPLSEKSSPQPDPEPPAPYPREDRVS